MTKPLAHALRCLVALALPAIVGSTAGASDPAVVKVGAGSYLSSPPPNARTPGGTPFLAGDRDRPVPTNDWCSSLYWDKFSQPHYAHPLAMQATAAGLHVFYPGANIAGTKDAIFGFMPAGKGDLVVGHSAVDAFDEKRVAGESDWFVDVLWEKGPAKLTASYGHGSPYVFAKVEGGDATVTFAEQPKVWSGDANSATVAVTIAGKAYGLFAPKGATWTGLDTTRWTCRLGGSGGRFAVAILPEATPEALKLFDRYARFPVTGTTVRYAFDDKTGAVTTDLAFATADPAAAQPAAGGTLTALYPHQWRTIDPQAQLTGYVYPSVRGPMKLAIVDPAGDSRLRTAARFPGVLPSLPKVAGGADAARIAEYLRRDLAADDLNAVRDTYWDGKLLGKWATLLPIAEQYGLDVEAAELTRRIKSRLEDWFTATGPDGKPKTARVFAYDRTWTTLTGYPASFGSDDQLNDHHFHYGYFLRAAGEIVRRDPAWGADDRWGGMIKLLIRDIAGVDRKDSKFPFLRNFDPYAGHSWASGHARFGDGNNNESSSEAMNAWYGMVLFGHFMKDRDVRDLGVWLYTTEMLAIEDYWFGVHGDTFAAGYTPTVVTMVWGGKGANGTWFSGEPEAIHGINFLPVTGGSLYLGRYPDYAGRNWQAMIAERQKRGGPLKQWEDVLLMYRALSDPADATGRFDAALQRGLKPEAGNSLAATYLWIATLSALGQVDRDAAYQGVLSAAFAKDGRKTVVRYGEDGRWQVNGR